MGESEFILWSQTPQHLCQISVLPCPQHKASVTLFSISGGQMKEPSPLQPLICGSLSLEWGRVMRWSLFKEEHWKFYSCTKLNVKLVFLLKPQVFPQSLRSINRTGGRSLIFQSWLNCVTFNWLFNFRQKFLCPPLNFRFLICKTETMICKWQSWKPAVPHPIAWKTTNLSFRDNRLGEVVTSR